MGMHLSSRTTTQPRVRHPTPLAEQRIWVTSRVPESLEGFLQAGHGEPGEGGGCIFSGFEGNLSGYWSESSLEDGSKEISARSFTAPYTCV